MSEKKEVSWAAGASVWVEVKEAPDKTMSIEAQYEDPQKNVKDWFDICPTTQIEAISRTNAIKKAEEMLAHREEWPNG